MLESIVNQMVQNSLDIWDAFAKNEGVCTVSLLEIEGFCLAEFA